MPERNLDTPDDERMESRLQWPFVSSRPFTSYTHSSLILSSLPLRPLLDYASSTSLHFLPLFHPFPAFSPPRDWAFIRVAANRRTPIHEHGVPRCAHGPPPYRYHYE
jgi:hypothetical protein